MGGDSELGGSVADHVEESAGTGLGDLCRHTEKVKLLHRLDDAELVQRIGSVGQPRTGEGGSEPLENPEREPLPFDPGHAAVGPDALKQPDHELGGLFERGVIVVVGMDVGLVAEGRAFSVSIRAQITCISSWPTTSQSGRPHSERRGTPLR